MAGLKAWRSDWPPGSDLGSGGAPPAALTRWGSSDVKPPRELAERYFHVTTWAEHDRGGHFPAVAEPQLLADTLRDVFRPLRTP
jgi:hypothetical protein